MKKMIPNLFIVGAPKCGTTSIHDYLNQHPQIELSKIKELKYFCSDVKEVFIPRSLEDYLKQFIPKDNTVYVGEATAYYIISKEALHGIKKMNPDAKIIFTIRNPRDILRSVYSQLVFAGIEKDISLEEALEIESTLNKSGFSEIEKQSFQNKCYRDIPLYAKHIADYIKVFGRENVHIIIFDDLKKDPLATINECFKFLQIEQVSDLNIEIKNSAMTNRNRKFREFMVNPPSISKKLLRVILPSPKLRSKLFVFINWLNAKPSKNTKISEETIKYLNEHFKSEVAQLSKLSGRDLTHWSN